MKNPLWGSNPEMVKLAGAKDAEQVIGLNALTLPTYQDIGLVNYFKKGIKAAGFDIKDGDSAIVPVMLYDAKLSQTFADKLLQEGIYVIGFFYPVVPKDKARIRVQLSAAHSKEHLDKAITAFTKIGKELGVIK